MDDHLERHAARIAELVAEFEAGEDDPVKAKVFALLENIDHLHRTCVWRLFELTTELGGKGLVDRLAADPAVKMLFVLYDLILTEPLRPVVGSAPVTTPYTGGLIPLGTNRMRQKEAWQVAFARQDLPPGTLQAVEVDGLPVLLCSLDADVYAYRNTCGGTALPLHLGTLTGGEIHCPWHGCRYDARTGKQIGGSGIDLVSLPVTFEGGMIRVAIHAAD
jgi:3-phenylpropionate/trans-cinnamate dioxygenase ferredoxin subunit